MAHEMKLQLHRSRQKPDWELVAVAERNWSQRLAAATSGIVTPANCMTILGVVLVGYGLILLPSQLFYGVAFILVGRLFDLLDGIVADATGTKGPLGELMDATADKIVLFGTGLAVGALGFISWFIIIPLFLQNIANVLIGYNAKKHHVTLHPSSIGKVATTLQWAGIIGLIATYEIPIAQPLAYLLTFTGFIAGVISAQNYLRTLCTAK